MPSCSVTGCRSKTGYRRYDTIGRRISIHRFPTNPVLREMWVRRLNKKNWVCTENSGVCSLHFKETDFDDDYRASCQDIVRKLRKTAIPSIGLLGLDPILGTGIKPRNRAKPKSVSNGNSNAISEEATCPQSNVVIKQSGDSREPATSPADSLDGTMEEVEDDITAEVAQESVLTPSDAGSSEPNDGAINLSVTKNGGAKEKWFEKSKVTPTAAVANTSSEKAVSDSKVPLSNRATEKAEPRERVLGLVALPETTHLSKYSQLLIVIEEVSKDIRPTYASSRSSAERLKRGIMHARLLVRECLMELDKGAKN